jgi:hypothetical protein
VKVRFIAATMIGSAPWIAGHLGYWVYGDWALAWRVAGVTTLAMWLPSALLIALLWPRER